MYVHIYADTYQYVFIYRYILIYIYTHIGCVSREGLWCAQLGSCYRLHTKYVRIYSDMSMHIYKYTYQCVYTYRYILIYVYIHTPCAAWRFMVCIAREFWSSTAAWHTIYMCMYWDIYIFIFIRIYIYPYQYIRVHRYILIDVYIYRPCAAWRVMVWMSRGLLSSTCKKFNVHIQIWNIYLWICINQHIHSKYIHVYMYTRRPWAWRVMVCLARGFSLSMEACYVIHVHV